MAQIINWYESDNEKEDEKETTETRRGTKENFKADSRENSTTRKKMIFTSHNETEDTKPKRKPLELETDPLVLQRRQKQIDYGKNTVGYHKYIQQVPIDMRTKEDPKTPDKYTKYSRRSWDMLIKMWRKKLHQYDIKATKEREVESDEDSDL